MRTPIVVVDPGIDVLRELVAATSFGTRAAVREALTQSSLVGVWGASATPMLLLWIVARLGRDRSAALRVAGIVIDSARDLLDITGREDALATALRIGVAPVDDDTLERAAASLRGLAGDDARGAASVTAWGAVDGLLGAALSWLDDATFVELVPSIARRASNARSFVEPESDWDARTADAIRAAWSLSVEPASSRPASS